MIDTELKAIVNEFNKLLKSDEYITYRNYNAFLEKYSHVFSDKNSNNDLIRFIANKGYEKIEIHNERYINQLLLVHKNYFNRLFEDIDSNISLDDEQRKAIVNEEDYSLIIAGAGKTTTMAAKVKYLIDICHIHPSKIAVVSYTNKATSELESRIKYDFNLKDIDIMTFHSLGMKIIRKIFKNPLEPISENIGKEIITDFVKEVLFPNKELLTKYIKTFNKYNYNGNNMFSKGFVANYQKFATFQDYFSDYKKRKQEQNSHNLKDICDFFMKMS